jgi:hypothetical protein
MRHFDSVLRVYADQGFRSAEEWLSLGRDVVANFRPRVDAQCHGRAVGLFSRDQTRPDASSSRNRSKDDSPRASAISATSATAVIS